MNALQKWGGFAALYAGISYIVGMVGFLAFTDYGSAEGAAEQLTILGDSEALMYTLELLVFVAFGFALVLLVTALDARLKAGAPIGMRVAGIFGFIWAGVVIASGMIFNIGMGAALDLQATDPAGATTMWSSVGAVAEGLGGGNEILGGVWMLLVSFAALRLREFPRVMNYLGLLAGIAGLVSAVPVLADTAGAVFGVSQLVWFLWIGFLMVRRAALRPEMFEPAVERVPPVSV